ncbi:MAG: ATP-binding protein [Cyclobacteriaceae bacterium]
MKGVNLIFWYQKLLSFSLLILAMSPAFGQNKQLVQIRASGEDLKPIPGLSLSINNGGFITLDKKGIAFTELSDSDLPVKNIKVNDSSLEPASWNYSKGVLEVIVRRKSYHLVNLTVQYQDGKPATSVRVTYQGQKEIQVSSDNLGRIELPLPLNESVSTTTQFTVEGHRIVELLGGDIQRLIVELIPREPAATQEQKLTNTVKLDTKSLDTVKSLSGLFGSIGEYTQLSESDKQQLDEKFSQLFAEVKDSIVQRQTYLDRISNTSYVNEDIKNLLNQVGSEDRLLQQQREEFNAKIAVIESKLNSGFSTLSQTERKGLLNDLNALESLLSENESRFFENHNDYRQIINGLKEKYFDVERLESQLSESESKRIKEQELFREQMLIAAGVLALLSAVALLLVYFSNRLRKQKKQLIKANNEVIQMNENLEEIVHQRTSMLREANEELDTFLYRASHDLRSPLCSIKGLVNISPYLTKDELIDKVGDTMHNMDRLLEKLEMVSEIAGSERHSRVKIIDLIKKVEYRFSEFILRYNELFVIDCPTDLEIVSDENLLESIINNLVENAVYFGAVENRKRPEVRVTASFRDQNLILSVYDNGVGIDREVRDRIYNMFFKGHIKSRGHGLGLYIVNKAVQALNGNIVFETQPHQYTLFLVTIPVKQAVQHPHMAVAS